MDSKDLQTTPNGERPADTYDDGNIPDIDMPGSVLPDEVPRTDGPGGEN